MTKTPNPWDTEKNEETGEVMKATQMKISNELVNVEFQQDAINQCLRVMARTNPARQVRKIWYQKLSSEPCYWTYSKWAKVIRWILRKKWLRRLVPYPIECLTNATEVVATPCVWEIPEEADASIKAQLAGWNISKPPTMIVIGRAAHYEIIQSKHFSIFSVSPTDSNSSFELYGVPAIVTDKIEDGAAIVI